MKCKFPVRCECPCFGQAHAFYILAVKEQLMAVEKSLPNITEIKQGYPCQWESASAGLNSSVAYF